MRDNRPRVFVDSSVVIAAAISSSGYARELLLSSIRGDIALVWSQFVLDETERNLTRKAPAAVPVFKGLQASLHAEIITPGALLVRQAEQIVDPKDAPIVAAAAQAGARWLASYDRRHLHAQREAILAEFGVVVATPDEILDA